MSADRARYRRMKQIIVALKGDRCSDCKQQFPWWVYDLDHRDPYNKHDRLSQMLGSAAETRIFDEAAKCDLVCSNCHRTRTINSLTARAKTASAMAAHWNSVKTDTADDASPHYQSEDETMSVAA